MLDCLSNASQHVPIYLQPFLRYSKLLVENFDIFTPHLCLAAPQGVIQSEFREDLDIHKTRMNGLSCGEESTTICSAVLIQYQRVTDGRTDVGRTDGQRNVQPISITCFSIADARNYKNPSRFSRVMITNFLPPFYGSPCMYARKTPWLHFHSKTPCWSRVELVRRERDRHITIMAIKIMTQWVDVD